MQVHQDQSIDDILVYKSNFYLLMTSPQVSSSYKIVVLNQNTLEAIYATEAQQISEIIDFDNYIFGRTLIIEDDILYITNDLSETEREKIMVISENAE